MTRTRLTSGQRELQYLRASKDMLKSGTSIRPKRLFKQLFSLINPFAFYLIDGIFSVLLNVEVSLFNEARHNILRESSISLPGLYPAAVRPAIEENVSINNVTRAITRDEQRERGRYSIGFAPIIWITGFLVAFAPEDIRLQFTTRALQFGDIPQFYSEVFKRTRTSTCGLFYIKPALLKFSQNAFLMKFPEFRNSILDPSFLYTNNGIQNLFSVLAYLRNAEGNYVPFVKATIQSLPEINSGDTTRALAIGTENITDPYSPYQTSSSKTSWFTDSCVYVTSGHAYGKTVEATHVVDSLLVMQIHSDTNDLDSHKSTIYKNLSSVNEMVHVNATTMMACQHIVHRVFGIEPNPSRDRRTVNTPKTEEHSDVPTTDPSSNSFVNNIIDRLKTSSTNELRSLTSLLKQLIPLLRIKKNKEFLQLLFAS